jgi:hypothetical protein
VCSRGAVPNDSEARLCSGPRFRPRVARFRTIPKYACAPDRGSDRQVHVLILSPNATDCRGRAKCVKANLKQSMGVPCTLEVRISFPIRVTLATKAWSVHVKFATSYFLDLAQKEIDTRRVCLYTNCRREMWSEYTTGSHTQPKLLPNTRG